MQNHLIIQNALLCEARPLIGRYRLKKDFTFTKFDVFRNEQITLIVSGIGRLKAAVATTHILDRLSGNQPLIILNIGIAGSSNFEHGVGNSFLINKIIDTNTVRKYYPDLLFKHELPEIQIATFDQIVTNAETIGDYYGLMDMEAVGFATAALTFLSPHQVVLLKIVSDHLDVDHLSATSVSKLIADEMPAIEKLIGSLQNLEFILINSVPEPEQAIIDTITEYLRLTVSQQRILANDLLTCHSRLGEIPAGWEVFIEPAVQTKAERNQRFAALREFFSGK
ncbi:MAG: hypothetical protein H8E14_04750 [Candidatus Marinimicrobia bacterium]|nr:hypothetical protein [Candidatus Neomarinimicrobiota bacterium]